MTNEVLQNLTTPVVLLDRRLQVTWLNQAAEVLLETSQGRIQGESIEGLIRRIDGSGGRLIDASSLPSPENLRTTTVRAARVRLPSGAELTLDYTLSPLQPDALVLELHPLDPSGASREGGQSAHLEAARGLLKGLAHEIKNPLGGLRGAAQLLQSELGETHLTEYTRVIIDEADRLRELVDRLLLPKTRARPMSINIHRALERVLQLLRAEFLDIEVVRDYDPSLPDFAADEAQLIQALLNIAKNAAQVLCERGAFQGVTPTIRLRTRVARQVTVGSRRHRFALRVDVIDNGPGIAPAIADRIFVPFVTDRPRGSGLGLAIAADIAAQHHGNLEYASKPGETRFTMTLPAETVLDPVDSKVNHGH